MFISAFADIPVCVYQSMSLMQTGMTPFGLRPQSHHSHSRVGGYVLKPSVFRRLIQIKNP
ncbi:MAG: hypothetical protein EVJ48_00975 [Candidatus Acidulodesulfobacterium acidiphilum]|uniref:Uncharacterized protein n=1 Tax=Candidatus Acidulodesulfobacterium acidiphilum TaxID=2597224 RepID=A0A520XHF4_9DELT|nr:MAG: hypothetical protein EVJ48_00975 [Candidatus Acidulodesulfobacterium acidiphilum]